MLCKENLDICTIYTLIGENREREIFTETFSNPAPCGSQLFTDVPVLNIMCQVGSWNTPGQGHAALVQKT